MPSDPGDKLSKRVSSRLSNPRCARAGGLAHGIDDHVDLRAPYSALRLRMIARSRLRLDDLPHLPRPLFRTEKDPIRQFVPQAFIDADLRSALESTGIPYMVTGSFVSSVHGVPRATQDIDVIVEPTRDQLLALMNIFSEPDYDSDTEDALNALRHRSTFSVIDRRGIWKIDFIVRKDRPFSKRELGRRVKIDILGVPLDAATPEDLLLAKLEWAKLGESDRQIRDAAGIIEIQGATLDLDYVQKWAVALDIEDQLQAAREKAH